VKEKHPMSDLQQKYDTLKAEHDALGTLFAATIEKIHDLWLRTKPDGTLGPDSELWRIARDANKAVCDLYGLTDDDWECIFDVDRPVSEWRLEENQDLLEEDHRARLLADRDLPE
jgi:hypothetical protein